MFIEKIPQKVLVLTGVSMGLPEFQVIMIKDLSGEAEKSAAGIGEETGVLLVEVPPTSAAAKAGLVVGDVILKVEGLPVDTISDLQEAMRATSKKRMELTVFNATERTIKIRSQP